MKTILHVFGTLLLATVVVSARAQEVSIPDPGLNSAIREALQKPSDPLTQEDLLSLTNLDAQRRGITNLSGLEAARNLVILNLDSNRLGTFAFPSSLTHLKVLNLSLNSLRTCTLVDGLTTLASLILEDNNLTNFVLPAGLTGLTNLDLDNNQITRFDLPSNFTSLVSLDLGFNLITEFSLPSGLTNLSDFFIGGNLLTNITLPQGLGQLTELYLAENQLTSVTFPPGMTNLLDLNLFFNALTNLNLPADVGNLTSLDVDFNQLTTLDLPPILSRLSELHVRSNLLTTFSLPAGMMALKYLDIGENHLSNVALSTDLNQLQFLRCSGNEELRSLTLPVGLTNLTGVFLRYNQLTNLTLPSDLSRLVQIDALGNQLANLILPPGLISLTNLFLSGNQLTSLTLPPDMTQLVWLVLDGNPLTTLVLSQPLAASNLQDTVATLQGQGVSVFTYPLAIQLVRPRPLTGAFQFGITGPPGVYVVLGSADLVAWTEVGIATNSLGSVAFNDVESHLSPLRFYRAQLQTPPTNMVFISPGTFLMGSPTNDFESNVNERPQTQVTFSRGFWIGKYEVTQKEYLSVMNTNPSVFAGDLQRPVSNVSWFDATNYCWKLTQQELLAGRIPAGSQYRLPTEAEWECAARAGTSTRFSYGDDMAFTSLTNYAWYSLNAELRVHAVGQKLPNAWGLYDMEGNVWEWCQDWFGPLPGGVQTDPTGPATSPDGLKVMRGGAYDYPNAACRSASRLFFAASPFLSDSDLGFRVVLAAEQS